MRAFWSMGKQFKQKCAKNLKPRTTRACWSYSKTDARGPDEAITNLPPPPALSPSAVERGESLAGCQQWNGYCSLGVGSRIRLAYQRSVFPLTPTLSPSAVERENRWQVVGKGTVIAVWASDPEYA